MKQNKIILVISAASPEGEYVTRALLRQQQFRVRIMVNDTSARRARILQRAGAELFRGDASSQHDLLNAMENVYGVFGHSDHWKDPGMEWNKGKNIADAAKASKVQHLVFHSMPPTHGNRIEAYIRSAGIKSSFIQSGFFFEYFLHQFAPQRDHNSGYYFEFPQGEFKLPAYSLEDLGNIVAAVFSEPENYLGRTIRPVAEDLTAYQYAAILSRELNKFIYYNQVAPEVYAAYNLPFAASWAEFFQMQPQAMDSDREETYRIHAGTMDFGTWVKRNREKFLAWFNSLFDAIVI